MQIYTFSINLSKKIALFANSPTGYFLLAQKVRTAQ